MIEQIDQCIFEIARGDITKYDVIGQQPADLFFKWLKWLRRDEKQRMEFEAAIHGIKVSNSGSAAGDEKKIDRMFDVAGNLRGKIAVQRVKKSKKPRA